MRVGLHTGHVLSGVVGRIKPQFSLFGDTVNTTARLQFTGERLKVHMSGVFRASYLAASNDGQVGPERTHPYPRSNPSPNPNPNPNPNPYPTKPLMPVGTGVPSQLPTAAQAAAAYGAPAAKRLKAADLPGIVEGMKTYGLGRDAQLQWNLRHKPCCTAR